MKLWFGAHEGKDLSEVPKHYLQWLIERTEPPKRIPEDSDESFKARRERWFDLLSAAEEELEERAR